MENRKGQQKGFTLIELLLAAAIGGMLIVAILHLFFSFSQLAGGLRETDIPEKHTAMVRRFLQDAWQDAGHSQKQDTQSFRSEQDAESIQNEESSNPQIAEGANSPSSESVFWERPSSWSRNQDPLLSFYLHQPSAFFNWTDLPAGRIKCYLQFREAEGLFIIWRPTLLRDQTISGDETFFETRISPYVTELVYAYFDEEQENWGMANRPEEKNDQTFERPKAIILTLTFDDDLKKTITLPLPASSFLPIP